MNELETRRIRHGETGASLIELLVATTILAIATVVALQLYDAARRSFHIGENVAEEQQAVRIAFDLISSDLRMAGFNTNPDGNKARPDEQIEAAELRAVVIRADFDAHDPVESLTPESTLSGGAFLSVSTGNDEIRTYVLAKPDGSSNGTLTFEADVGQAVRDGVVETINVPNVDLVHDDPPYTLYRITLEDDASLTRVPLIENVRSMEFHYFDRAGNEIAPPPGTDTPANRASRSAIRRVSVELEGLTRDPDLRWTDANDTNPTTRAFRKFKLSGDVTPRNLGMAGLKDYQSDTAPPSRPASPPSAFPGHCDGLFVSWSPNPPQDEVAYYRVRYVDPSNQANWFPATGSYSYIGGLLSGVQYRVSVQAVDAAGNQSPLSPETFVVTQNILPANRPEAVAGLSASAGQNGRVDLSWQVVTQNVGATTGDLQAPLLRDLAGYRVYRGTTPGFVPGPSNLLADASSVPAIPAPTFSDTQAVNCRPYYYRIGGVDRCLEEGLLSPEISASAWSDLQPKAPGNTGAFFDAGNSIRVNWVAPHQDVLDNPITIDEFKVFRTGVLPDTTDPTSLGSGDFSLLSTVSGASDYYDNSVTLQTGEAVWYRVTALDACSPANESDPSGVASPACYFSGTPQIQSPSWWSRVWGPTDLHLQVVGGSGVYNEARFSFRHVIHDTQVQYSVPMSGPSVVFPWQALPGADGPDFFVHGLWRVNVEVDQLIGLGPSVCTSTTSRIFYVSP